MSDTKYPSQRAEQFVIRFEADGIRDRLKERATRNRRSLNAEINARLVSSLDSENEKASTATLGS